MKTESLGSCSYQTSSRNIGILNFWLLFIPFVINLSPSSLSSSVIAIVVMKIIIIFIVLNYKTSEYEYLRHKGHQAVTSPKRLNYKNVYNCENPLLSLFSKIIYMVRKSHKKLFQKYTYLIKN